MDSVETSREQDQEFVTEYLNQASERISRSARQRLDQNRNSASIFIPSNSTADIFARCDNLHPVCYRPSKSDYEINNAHYHIRNASNTGQLPSYENLRKKIYLMESKAALYCPPVSTFLCGVMVLLYFFREKMDVFGEDDIYVRYESREP